MTDRGEVMKQTKLDLKALAQEAPFSNVGVCLDYCMLEVVVYGLGNGAKRCDKDPSTVMQGLRSYRTKVGGGYPEWRTRIGR